MTCRKIMKNVCEDSRYTLLHSMGITVTQVLENKRIER